VLVTVAVLAVVCSATISYSSADALPGQPLHQVKTGLEVMRVAMARDDVAATQLHLEIASTRLDEVEALLRQQRLEGVEAAMGGFEADVRQAVLTATKLARAGHPDAAAAQGMVKESLAGSVSRLNTLRHLAPEEAHPALDHGLQVLETESGAVEALFSEYQQTVSPTGEGAIRSAGANSHEGQTPVPELSAVQSPSLSATAVPASPSRTQTPHASTGVAPASPAATSVAILVSASPFTTVSGTVSRHGTPANPPVTPTPSSKR
jgi:hypothetical protein